MRSYSAPLHNIPKATFLPSFGLLWILILFVPRRNFEWLRCLSAKMDPFFCLKVKSLELRYLSKTRGPFLHLNVVVIRNLTQNENNQKIHSKPKGGRNVALGMLHSGAWYEYILFNWTRILGKCSLVLVSHFCQKANKWQFFLLVFICEHHWQFLFFGQRVWTSCQGVLSKLVSYLKWRDL